MCEREHSHCGGSDITLLQCDYFLFVCIKCTLLNSFWLRHVYKKHTHGKKMVEVRYHIWVVFIPSSHYSIHAGNFCCWCFCFEWMRKNARHCRFDRLISRVDRWEINIPFDPLQSGIQLCAIHWSSSNHFSPLTVWLTVTVPQPTVLVWWLCARVLSSFSLDVNHSIQFD